VSGGVACGRLGAGSPSGEHGPGDAPVGCLTGAPSRRSPGSCPGTFRGCVLPRPRASQTDGPAGGMAWAAQLCRPRGPAARLRERNGVHGSGLHQNRVGGRGAGPTARRKQQLPGQSRAGPPGANPLLGGSAAAPPQPRGGAAAAGACGRLRTFLYAKSAFGMLTGEASGAAGKRPLDGRTGDALAGIQIGFCSAKLGAAACST
jgi:hypothetical protein